jgi:hypothetical protein
LDSQKWWDEGRGRKEMGKRGEGGKEMKKVKYLTCITA